ncbi:MAG TPA: hypothetical protein VHJ20_03015 [Polyangia bacterium]|nr:hypothetical protein [Polyangia bacterium]
MSETPHISADAMALAALEPRDPERVAATRHARSCTGCAQALRNAEDLLKHLAALPEEKPPSAGVLRDIAGPVVRNLSLRAVPSALIAGVLACVWTGLVLTARHRLGGGPALAGSAALLACAAASVFLVRRLGGAATVATMIASTLMVALAWQETGAFTPDGLMCLLTEVEVGAIPFVILLGVFLRRRTLDLTAPLVSVAAAGALAGQAALHLTCPGRGAGLHLLAFHAGGVVATIAAAAAAARVSRVIFAR